MRRLGAGSPEPLGLTLVAGGANVAVFSAHARAIELCLFDRDGETELERIALPERTGDVFHGFVSGVVEGTRYGLRAHGPYDPRHGQRFNAAKLLVDPYARALDRRFTLHAALFGGLPDGVTRNDADSAPFVPKGIATPPPALRDRTVRVPWRDTIIYELHVRGFTRLHGGVPEPLRGTCAGLAQPAAIEHLVRLGVTTVELMPLAAAIDEPHLAAQGLVNYWRYNPVAFLAPDPWLAPGGGDEVARTIAALHAAGLEVVLDVVLNHTGESNELGPTLSLRGLDNATYYRTLPGDAARYINDTGTGNTLALDRPPVLRLAMDALRHYAALGFDGFRFDLATVLGRREDGFDPAAPLLQAIAQDPLLRASKLIAEPWDLGPGGYQLGAFPADWGEWNDAYRDMMRLFWRGDPGMVGPLATRIAGSADIFAARSRPLSRAINFVTAHDGFTLADLVAYAEKHNAANGEGNRDGTDANYSWNHGVEGATGDPAVAGARARDVRALLAALLLSRGTPMLAMGDELGRTQQGNNNAYAQDNAITWIDWPRADRALVDFTAALIALRKGHPALRSERPLTGRAIDATGIPDVEWLRPDGAPMTDADWSGHRTHVLIAAFYTPATGDLPADRVVVALNAGDEPALVEWPEARPRHCWRVALDTFGAGAREPAADDDLERSTLAARTVLAVVETAAAAPAARTRDIAPDVLARLARAAGIAPEWYDVAGTRHVVGRDTTRAILAAMGLDVRTTFDARERLAAIAESRERRPLPPVCVARAGVAADIAIAVDGTATRRRRALRLRDEHGVETRLDFNADHCLATTVAGIDGRGVTRLRFALPPLPPGYHTLAFEDEPERACRIIVAPERCHMPPDLANGKRRFGLAAHLYALRRHGDQGVGDLSTLAAIGAATARAGGACVGINPLHALYADDRERASPYHPSDRRFVDPIYIDVTDVPDFRASEAARALFAGHASAIAALAARRNVDYAGVWAVKRAVLAACFATFEMRGADDSLVAEFERFAVAGSESLARFATFEAIASTLPRVPWPQWPAGLAHPGASGVEEFVHANEGKVRFAIYLQWLADRQLAAAVGASGLALGLYRDLAVGCAPDGAEAWANTGGMLARGASIGAPPDPLAEAGQNWNLPPPIPGFLVASGYTGFRELVAANMRHAGALRIDHVPGLTRLFWIPDGATPLDGAYVRYPQEDLLAVLALESTRARCLVVGEDLGTVPAELRERLDAANILSYRVLWFERDGAAFRAPAAYAPKATACVSTHDLPTIAGWWSGSDIDEKRALGLFDDVTADAARQERALDKARLATALAAAGIDGVDPARRHASGVTAAIHRFIGAAPSSLALVQADDLAGETVALNVPGTDRERPNWRRKVGVDVSALWDTPPGIAARRDLKDRSA